MFKILKFEHFQVRLLDTDLAQTEKGVTRAQLRRYLFKNTIERVFTQFRWYVFFLTQLRRFLPNWEGKNSTNPFHPYCATSIYVGVFMIILKILMFWFFRQNDVWTLLAAAVGGDKRGEDNTILPLLRSWTHDDFAGSWPDLREFDDESLIIWGGTDK